MTKLYDAFRHDAVHDRNTRTSVALSLEDAAERAGVDAADIEAAIEDEGWCGAICPTGDAIVIQEHDDRLIRSAAYFLEEV